MSKVQKQARKAAEAAEWNPMRELSHLGIRSNHAYTAGLAALALSVLTRIFSGKKNATRDGSRRRGVATFAPLLFLLGVGLKLEEKR